MPIIGDRRGHHVKRPLAERRVAVSGDSQGGFGGPRRNQLLRRQADAIGAEVGLKLDRLVESRPASELHRNGEIAAPHDGHLGLHEVHRERRGFGDRHREPVNAQNATGIATRVVHERHCLLRVALEHNGRIDGSGLQRDQARPRLRIRIGDELHRPPGDARAGDNWDHWHLRRHEPHAIRQPLGHDVERPGKRRALSLAQIERHRPAAALRYGQAGVPRQLAPCVECLALRHEMHRLRRRIDLDPVDRRRSATGKIPDVEQIVAVGFRLPDHRRIEDVAEATAGADTGAEEIPFGASAGLRGGVVGLDLDGAGRPVGGDRADPDHRVDRVSEGRGVDPHAIPVSLFHRDSEGIDIAGLLDRAVDRDRKCQHAGFGGFAVFDQVVVGARPQRERRGGIAVP